MTEIDSLLQLFPPVELLPLHPQKAVQPRALTQKNTLRLVLLFTTTPCFISQNTFPISSDFLSFSFYSSHVHMLNFPFTCSKFLSHYIFMAHIMFSPLFFQPYKAMRLNMWLWQWLNCRRIRQVHISRSWKTSSNFQVRHLSTHLYWEGDKDTFTKMESDKDTFTKMESDKDTFTQMESDKDTFTQMESD